MNEDRNRDGDESEESPRILPDHLDPPWTTDAGESVDAMRRELGGQARLERQHITRLAVLADEPRRP